ncbi:MAG: hypothetical protein S4CHLAM123_12050 [Chlamydiales bacterium]|nr:hypothetical protein [Chlamydiales bacterium]
MYPIILFVIAAFAILIHFYLSKNKTFARLVELSLAYIIPLNIGVGTLIGFIAHAFYGPEIAAKIGWPAHNPFQFEVAIGNLAMSVAGFMCIWQKKGFWLATTIFSGIFFLGAAFGHIVQMVVHENYSPYNSGPFLYIGDIAIPLLYLTLALIYSGQNHFFKKNHHKK